MTKSGSVLGWFRGGSGSVPSGSVPSGSVPDWFRVGSKSVTSYLQRFLEPSQILSSEKWGLVI